MRKCIAIAAIALVVFVGASPAHAQRGGPISRGTVNNGGGARYYGYPTSNGAFYGQSFYGYTYPYNTASATFGGQFPDDVLMGLPFVPSAISSSVSGGSGSYGAAAYAVLQQESKTSALRRVSEQTPVETTARSTVHVLLPESDARVYFDDSATTETGADRVYTTPALDPAKSYTYTIRATWTTDGQPVSRSKEVKIQPGKDTTVDFRSR
jgi:uncharacterized protein (TIGR03000 family)